MDKNFNTPEEYFKSFQRDPEKSFNSILAGGAIWSMIALFFFGIAVIITAFIHLNSYKLFLFLVSMVPSSYLCYKFLFKDDLYLKYFKKFDKKPYSWQKKWSWITFITAAGVILFLIGCFTVHSKIINH